MYFSSVEPNKREKESEYASNLRCLRELHEVECEMYRRKPNEHPLYQGELQGFITNGGSPAEFLTYWQEKLEQIFIKSWEDKKKELTLAFLDRNKKEKDEKDESKALVIDLTEEKSLSPLWPASPEPPAPKSNSPSGELKGENSSLDKNEKLNRGHSKNISSTSFSSTHEPKTSEVLNNNKVNDVCAMMSIKNNSCSSNQQTLVSMTPDNKNEKSGSVSQFDRAESNDFSSNLTLNQSEIECSQHSDNELHIDECPDDNDDINIDDLVVDPDFLNGLDALDKEFRNVGFAPDSLDKVSTYYAY